ncbi:MAG: hypothetical protein DDG60_00010 [Anaerolineae bacterium]|nr:MAG: hypothetical protein DDG60_00010 [Anaerolineae bacterium]
MRYQRQILIFVCAICLVIGFFAPWNPSKVLAVVSCKGEGTTTFPSCTGKFASYQGCAATNASDPNYWTFSGAKIERRESKDCDAKWTRITNVSGSTRYTAGSTNYGCARYDCGEQSIQSNGAITNNSQVYTPMKGLRGTPVLSCGATNTAAMSLPIYSPYPEYVGCRAW